LFNQFGDAFQYYDVAIPVLVIDGDGAAVVAAGFRHQMGKLGWGWPGFAHEVWSP